MGDRVPCYGALEIVGLLLLLLLLLRPILSWQRPNYTKVTLSAQLVRETPGETRRLGDRN